MEVIVAWFGHLTIIDVYVLVTGTGIAVHQVTTLTRTGRNLFRIVSVATYVTYERTKIRLRNLRKPS